MSSFKNDLIQNHPMEPNQEPAHAYSDMIILIQINLFNFLCCVFAWSAQTANCLIISDEWGVRQVIDLKNEYKGQEVTTHTAVWQLTKLLNLGEWREAWKHWFYSNLLFPEYFQTGMQNRFKADDFCSSWLCLFCASLHSPWNLPIPDQSHQILMVWKTFFYFSH